MEKIKCPNLECGRRILDIEVMTQGKMVLEIKCGHCGEIARLGYSPKQKKEKVHKRNRWQE